MTCSLTKAYALIGAAIAALVAAIAVAFFFFNVPGLIAAVALVMLVAGVPFTDTGLIAEARKAIRAYQACRGPGGPCSLGYSLDLLGQSIAFLSVFTWLAALALQITALGFLTSVFLSWLSIAPAAAGEVLKISGMVGAAACAAILVGTLTQLRSYEACLDSLEPKQEQPSPIN